MIAASPILIPPADSLHGEPGGEHLLGPGAALMRMCRPNSARLIRAPKLLGGHAQATADRHHGAAGRGERRLDGGHGQAGADQFAERAELSAADHQAGDCAQPERSGAGGGPGDSDRSREPGTIDEESQPVEALVQEAFKSRPELEQAVLTLRNDEITLKGARNAVAADAGCLRLLRIERTGRIAEPELDELPNGRTLSTGQTSFDRIRDGADELVQQHGAGQGRWVQHDDSYPQPLGAGSAGAVADGVSPGGVAAGAALHADSHAGGECTCMR